MCSSTSGLFFGGKVASHMRSRRMVPKSVESFFPMPSTSASPIPKSPNINSQSTTEFPVRLSKNGLKGPVVPNFKNPDVGEVPESHDFAGSVA